MPHSRTWSAACLAWAHSRGVPRALSWISKTSQSQCARSIQKPHCSLVGLFARIFQSLRKQAEKLPVRITGDDDQIQASYDITRSSRSEREYLSVKDTAMWHCLHMHRFGTERRTLSNRYCDPTPRLRGVSLVKDQMVQIDPRKDVLK